MIYFQAQHSANGTKSDVTVDSYTYEVIGKLRDFDGTNVSGIDQVNYAPDLVWSNTETGTKSTYNFQTRSHDSSNNDLYLKHYVGSYQALGSTLMSPPGAMTPDCECLAALNYNVVPYP
jgi:hypothetical protein